MTTKRKGKEKGNQTKKNKSNKTNEHKPVPRDIQLYNKTKKNVYAQNPKHSAYRSGLLVKKYKDKFSKKYGTRRQPYIGNQTKKKGLSRWFQEKWKNQRGDIGYKFKSDVYRPTIRVTSKTPTTFKELNKKQIQNARTQKRKKGRVNRFKKEGGDGDAAGGTKKRKYTKSNKKVTAIKRDGKYSFKDFPDFKPNLSPRDMFSLGSFGGTYWRPIFSSVLDKNLKNAHKKYPQKWWKNIPEENLSSTECDITKNKYKVRVGTSLDFWESKGWINQSHPYGWVQWYCDFFMGKRSDDDERQISRWQKLAGFKGRFMRFLVTQIIKKKSKWDDHDVSPKIRQVLQHWGYKLTEDDYKYELNRRKIRDRK